MDRTTIVDGHLDLAENAAIFGRDLTRPVTAIDFDHHLEQWRQDGKPGLVLLMEGADPVRDPSHLASWWHRGLRLIGLTYGWPVINRAPPNEPHWIGFHVILPSSTRSGAER